MAIITVGGNILTSGGNVVTNDTVPAADYYVATNGSDSNPGTFAQPFKSWKKGFETATAGQTVMIRGGTYTSTGMVDEGNGYAAESISGPTGTSGSRITIRNYPGESPVYDLTGMTQATRCKGVSIKNCSYVTIKGLRVTGSDQTGISISVGCWMENMNHCIIEQCEFDHNEGTGLYFWGSNSEDNLFLNCDFHHNYEPGGGGGNSDGLSINYVNNRTGNQRINTVRGCRAWWNSDDGFDFVLNPGHVYVENCWSWYNGYIPDTFTAAGNGTGFKMGENDDHDGGDIDANYMRTVTNCLCFDNRANGYSQNESFLRMEFYNCTSYSNGMTGFFFWWHDVANMFRNNISYGDANTLVTTGSLYTSDHNSWDAGGPTVTDADFLSVSSTGVDGARQADGSLPSLNFMKIAGGSDLINAGVDVGLSYLGAAPDLGCFERE